MRLTQLTQFTLPSYAAGNSAASSANVYAQVSKIMQSQNTGAPQINAALANDTTTLSGLGKLMSALTSFQSVAQSLTTTGSDATQLAKNVTGLVSAYNSLNASLKGLQQGDLKTDSSVKRIQGQLGRILSMGSSGSTRATFVTPWSVGISIQKNGDLALDTTKLQKAISAAPDDVAKLFSNNGQGIADKLVSQIKGMIGQGGSIQNETAALNKDIASLSAKKASLTKALTLEANALMKQYSQGNTSGLGTSSQSSGSSSLFDMLG